MFRRITAILMVMMLVSAAVLSACSSSKTSATDPSAVTQNATGNYPGTIGADAAVGIALTESGASETGAEDLSVEETQADGMKIYVVSFRCDGSDFEFKINAQNGEIIEELINGSKVVV